jgi:hypothetical protein
MDPLTHDERIAALLDGRLSEQERAALLAELGASDDELELLVDSAGITAELEAEDRAAGVIPITTPRPGESEPRRIHRPPVWRRRGVLAGALAAVLVIGLAPFAFRRWTSTSGNRPGFLAPVAALSEADAGIPVGLGPRGPDTRGDGVQVGERAASLRFGTLAADVEVARRAGELDRVRAYSDTIATLLEEAGHDAAASSYHEVAARNTMPQQDELVRLASEARGLLRKSLVDLGVWTEAARVAVKRRDTRFFEIPDSRRYLEGKVDGLTQTGGAALERVRSARPRAGATDWNRLEAALDELLQDAG